MIYGNRNLPLQGLLNLGGLLGALCGDSYPQSLPLCEPRPKSHSLSLRVKPIEGRLEPATPFIVMMDELEERFLAVHRGSYVAIRVIEVHLFGDKLQMLRDTLEGHGYCIIDEHRL